MNKPFLLVLVFVVVIALVVLVVPASCQQGSNSAAPGVGAGGPEMPGSGGPPGGKPAGPPGMGGVPKGSHVDPPSDPVKAAPKFGLTLGIVAVVAIGVVLVMKKRKA